VIFDGVNNVDEAVSDGVIIKVTGTYTPTDDLLFYGTYSQGFRPGILNRPVGAAGPNGFTVPAAVDTDDVDNFELGWKTTLADNQLRFNGSAFFIDISDLQTTIFEHRLAMLSKVMSLLSHLAFKVTFGRVTSGIQLAVYLDMFSQVLFIHHRLTLMS